MRRHVSVHRPCSSTEQLSGAASHPAPTAADIICAKFSFSPLGPTTANLSPALGLARQQHTSGRAATHSTLAWSVGRPDACKLLQKWCAPAGSQHSLLVRQMRPSGGGGGAAADVVRYPFTSKQAGSSCDLFALATTYIMPACLPASTFYCLHVYQKMIRVTDVSLPWLTSLTTVAGSDPAAASIN